MKVISIMEPYASLIALELKRFETRSWATKYRGPIAIHASKKPDNQAVLMVAGNYPEIWHKISPLHPGCIIATANLTECFRINRDVIGGNVLLETEKRRTYFATKSNEFSFGDYTSGRFAWELTNVMRIEPIPAKGQLGLWNWEGGK